MLQLSWEISFPQQRGLAHLQIVLLILQERWSSDRKFVQPFLLPFTSTVDPPPMVPPLLYLPTSCINLSKGLHAAGFVKSKLTTPWLSCADNSLSMPHLCRILQKYTILENPTCTNWHFEESKQHRASIIDSGNTHHTLITSLVTWQPLLPPNLFPSRALSVSPTEWTSTFKVVAMYNLYYPIPLL